MASIGCHLGKRKALIRVGFLKAHIPPKVENGFGELKLEFRGFQILFQDLCFCFFFLNIHSIPLLAGQNIDDGWTFKCRAAVYHMLRGMDIDVYIRFFCKTFG